MQQFIGVSDASSHSPVSSVPSSSLKFFLTLLAMSSLPPPPFMRPLTMPVIEYSCAPPSYVTSSVM